MANIIIELPIDKVMNGIIFQNNQHLMMQIPSVKI